MTELSTLIQRLQAGLAASGQGTYQRRLPSKAARPDLLAARSGLRELSTKQPSVEVFRALALAEEALLNYPAAVQALEAALAQSSAHDRKDLKRLFLLKESAADWASLSLSPESLAALGQYLEVRLASQPCDHTLRHTKGWLKQQRIPSPAKILRGIQQAGGFCDCEVTFNVI